MPALVRRGRIGLATLLLAFSVPAAAQMVAAAPGVPQGGRTGMIVGQVVDQDGRPVPEAIVTMTMPRFLQNLDLRVGADPAIPSGRVRADAEGRFFFSDLPAGEYYLSATKEGFARGVFGERRPYGRAPLLALGEGERRTDVKIPVWKYAAIAGTVVDEAGEPGVGISVRALIKDVIGGATRFGNLQVRPDLVGTGRGGLRPADARQHAARLRIRDHLRGGVRRRRNEGAGTPGASDPHERRAYVDRPDNDH